MLRGIRIREAYIRNDSRVYEDYDERKQTGGVEFSSWQARGASLYDTQIIDLYERKAIHGH